MTKEQFDTLLPIKVPARVAKCPICESAIVVEELSEWFETAAGIAVTRLDGSISITCATEPDIDSAEWSEWMNSHWSTPYIDWLPVTQCVQEWLGRCLRKKPAPAATPRRGSLL